MVVIRAENDIVILVGTVRFGSGCIALFLAAEEGRNLEGKGRRLRRGLLRQLVAMRAHRYTVVIATLIATR